MGLGRVVLCVILFPKLEINYFCDRTKKDNDKYTQYNAVCTYICKIFLILMSVGEIAC